ncbi:MAG: FAD-dependent oxidoreductase, partial [Sulfurimonas sp.]|nr:FAD-dependent oxidoreductase [Sulfurimonas sp.]
KYDVVILGAGINGVAIAKALAIAGKKVLILEKNHIAFGASSNSSRLIHGGLRYLEQYEFSLIRESLQDQKYLLDTYPSLVKLRPFYFPIYHNSKRPDWMIGLGLWLYSLFAKHGNKASKVSKEEFFSEFKNIKDNNIRAIFKYYDAKTDDDALTHKIASEAQDEGVTILEETQLQKLQINDDIITLETTQEVFETNLLINATGAWIDEINKEFHLPSSYTIEKLSGIHIVIDSLLIPEPLLLETASKRIFFMIPEGETTIIGTTERSENSNVDDIKINNEDIEYLLQESNKYLKTELRASDIKEVYIGTRPIIKSKKEISQMSREYKLDLHHIANSRVLHIYGGKLTTFTSLARKVVKLLS